ncbi:MAG: energy transducer TonB [Paludibacteraceae bacterium]|nr:energy transducer TonB [Paludibacteraceae bacterium]
MKLFHYTTLIILLHCISFANYTFSQSPKTTTEKSKKTTVNKNCGCPYDDIELDDTFYDEPLFNADIKPSFVGGNEALKKYAKRLIQNPAKNPSDSSKHSVFCLFVVEEDGSISHPKIIHHSDSIFDKEALRFVETMPKWIPGRIDGKPARCWHSINLYFGYPSAN